jgi:Polyketide cyclase / dehydrase and lipid transport
MATATSRIDLAATADEVWKLIGGFGSIPDWLPLIRRSELTDGGRVRHLATPDGGVIVERLMVFDEKRRSYSYQIVQGPFPVKDYTATVTVTETDGGKASRVDWSGEFTPTTISDAEASKLFQGIFDDGLMALGNTFSNER